jgi:hypothetical protein
VVRCRDARRGGSFFDQLTDDPAVTAAAVGLLNGHSNPLGLLALGKDDFTLALAIITKADTISLDRRKRELTYLVDGIGHKVAETVGRMLG